MHSLLFEMKIYKHTFEIPELKVVNGDLVESGTIKETYTFTLLHKGMGLYEELSGKPLMATLINLKNEEDALEQVISNKFVQDLACASYVKIDGDKFHNNRATVEEFKKTAVYPKICEDVEFIQGLIRMAMECITDQQEKKKKTDSKNS